MAAMPPIPEELARFFERGLSITVATRDGELQPDGAPAWAARVHDDRARVTVYLHEGAASATLRNLAAHPEVAVLFEQPTRHRGCQVKGRFLSWRPAREDERREVLRQAEAFRDELEGIGIPRALNAAWTFWPCVAVELAVEQLFEQTPGPGCGEPLR